MYELLKANLHTKHRLSFRADGTFKILVFSDVQERRNFDPKTRADIEKMLDATAPDLVILCGDQCMGPDASSLEDFTAFLAVLAQPLEQRYIPWAHVFGNHDYDLNFDPFVQQALYEAYPFCVSKHTTDADGITNFMLPIYKHGSDEIGFNVWGMDTHQIGTSFWKDCGIAQPNEWTNKPFGIGRYDTLRFEQLLWYRDSSLALEQYTGHKVPSLMCMHIAPPEVALAINNPDESKLVGYNSERLDGGVLNSGLFSLLLQRGDVRCICAGHTHRNNFSADVYGINVCLDATAGWTCYGDDESRGGRVFEITEADPQNIKTYPVLYKDL